MPTRFDIRDRVVLVTGASSGIGRACAMAFARRGAKVVAAARRLDALEQLVAETSREGVAAVRLDVTVPAERAAALAFCADRFGGVDVLVNNAAWASFGTLAQTPDAHIDRMLSLNFLAPLAMSRAVLPGMLARGYGQIINISSVVGEQPMARMGVYCATKAALNALTTALRMELQGSGVDVLLVSPGSTRTSFFESAAQTDTAAVRFAERLYPPEKVARAVLRASLHRRAETTLTWEGRAISLIRRLSHRLADSIMLRVAQRSMPLRTPDGNDAPVS